MSMRGAVAIVVAAGLPEPDIEREKEIDMASAVLYSAQTPALRKRALERIEASVKARSPAAREAIAAAKRRRCG